ncbi:FHA domain-containing protein, partial [Streptomyces nitrosporeus]|uniref:FHA domain-containing protein n=1 Tax=Streptomyces nitrosporeus TaxID=28894 RepID=UPI0039A1AE30
MQIRLTVLAPRSGQTPARTCDVLVTAPAGTALAAVASALASAVTGPEGSQGGGAVVLYAGRERLDAQRRTLGEPPLVDGAVLSLQVPGEEEGSGDPAPARLHVVAGPDAGGVHLLHGGQVRIGRSADADVPLDDPDVSRLHCAVTVLEDGRVAVADLGSTNGTSLDGTPVHDRPVRLAPGALLRLGESVLTLTAGGRTPTLETAPDGEGHLRVTRPGTGGGEAARTAPGPKAPHGTEAPPGPADTGGAGGHGRARGDHPGALGPQDPHGRPGGPAGHGERRDAPGPGECLGPASRDTAGVPPQPTHGRGARVVPAEAPRRGGIG